jgi:hypothetical protein
MALPRTFVSFSSSDIGRYRMMCAWKANEHIDFNFADFQLDEAINSKNPHYIKSVCRARIRRADSFILLIGADTWLKTTFVKSEVEVAIEKGCRLIGVNINNCRFKDWLCPDFLAGQGALFVPFSSRIVARALESWQRGAGEAKGLALPRFDICLTWVRTERKHRHTADKAEPIPLRTSSLGEIRDERTP